MKTLLGTLAIASIALLQTAQADVAGIEVGGYQWTPDYKGTLASDSAALGGTSIDIKNDLGYSDDSLNILWASLEHPVPFLPNFKIVSSDLASSASSVLTRDIVFAGETYSVSDDVASTFDMSNTEYTFYYEVLDNWVSLDLGFTIREYDGEVQLATTTQSGTEALDFTIPLLYAAVRADLPFTGFFIDAEINIISYDDDSISDTTVGVGYESEIGLGAKAGYRTFSLDVKEDTFSSDLEFDGAYFSVFYHF